MPSDLQLRRTPATPATQPLDDLLEERERQAIIEALDQTRGNRTAAARLLGISFRQMRYRLKKLGIE
jgi:two-component system, NtrC family, response regulator PilR